MEGTRAEKMLDVGGVLLLSEVTLMATWFAAGTYVAAVGASRGASQENKSRVMEHLNVIFHFAAPATIISIISKLSRYVAAIGAVEKGRDASPETVVLPIVAEAVRELRDTVSRDGVREEAVAGTEDNRGREAALAFSRYDLGWVLVLFVVACGDALHLVACTASRTGSAGSTMELILAAWCLAEGIAETIWAVALHVTLSRGLQHERSLRRAAP